jgi:uncharacterized damage-inducible protein DinB
MISPASGTSSNIEMNLPVMRYQFLIDTYETERLKVLTVWSMFWPQDLTVRPHPVDPRGRSVLEQMVHQCLSENNWFSTMLGISVDTPILPEHEEPMGFVVCYGDASKHRLNALRGKDDAWWEEEVPFFDVPRSRAWIVVRRIAHTSHHRGQQTAMLRMLGRDLYSTYGPTADTGGLPANGGKTVYPFSDVDELIARESASGRGSLKAPPLPGVGSKPSTERPAKRLE